MTFGWKKRALSTSKGPTSSAPRRANRMAFSWDALEDRKVMSHGGGLHHLPAAAHVGSASSTTSNTALDTARQALQKDVQTILGASGTTIGELTTIHTTFQTLRADSLTPSSQSALSSFENGLVKSFASGTTLAGNATLLAQFEALYTSTPTTQQTTDLTAAYNALAAAVTSSNITSANITTIDADYAAVLTAESSTSTATYPYFTLVTGGNGRVGGEGFGGGGFGRGGFGGGAC